MRKHHQQGDAVTASEKDTYSNGPLWPSPQPLTFALP